ncbi:integration host factor subunit alpha [bacterium]|nr:integration host factor subunit alpha [candidate division CSSED10-310 bacterium]
MTKEDIINRVWENLDLRKKQAGEVVEELVNCIKDVLKSGEKLKIGGFGVFEVRERKARIGRNPKTGEKAEITAGQMIKFKAGKPLKTAVDK